MNRAGILREALISAAIGCLWAEEHAVWHTHTPQDLTAMRDRRRAQARVERVLTQAAQENLIDEAGQRRLLGVVLDAMVQVRWRHEPRHANHVPMFPVIERSLIADLRETWSQCVRRNWWGRAA